MTYPIADRITLDSQPGGLFRRPRLPVLPAVEPGFAHVLRINGAHVRREPTAGERNFGHVDLLSIVDIRSTAFVHRFAIPASGDAFQFEVAAQIVLEVTNPVTVVERGVDGYHVAIGAQIEQRVRNIGRAFDIEASAACELQIAAQLQDISIFNDALVSHGMRLAAIHPTVSLNAAATAHITRLVNLRRDRQLLEEQHRSDLLRTRQLHEIDSLKQAHWFEQIANGEHALLAAQLAQDPRALGQVINDLRAADQARLELAYRAFTEVIASDNVHSLVQNEAVKTITEEIRAVLQHKFGKLPPPQFETQALAQPDAPSPPDAPSSPDPEPSPDDQPPQRDAD